MLHPRTDLDAYANSWPREVDTRPGNLGDWPAPRATPTPPRSGQARHRRRHRGRHRAISTSPTTELAAAVAAGAVTDAAGHRAATHTLGPFELPPTDVPPVDAWPAEVMPDEAVPPVTPSETPAEQTRPAGWWRVPGDAEPRHPRARPPAARVAAPAAPVAERDRRPWLAGTALFVAVAVAGSWAVSSWQHPGDELPPPDTTAYGATGRLPDTHADPNSQNTAGASRDGDALSRDDGEATLAATTGGAARGAEATVGDPRIPPNVARAYRSAEARLADTAPGCGLSWSLLAGIGKVESDHARGGDIDAAGTTRTPILGPALDGTNGNAAIADTDQGELDGDTRWDRAVGPSQFIPTSWDIYGADGNDDGRSDPNNAYDAATATGRYLCAGGLDLTDPSDLNTAVFRYNHSQAYVDTVLGWARTYAGTPSTPGVASGAEPPVAAPERDTVIPVPPLASPPSKAIVKTPAVNTPTASSPAPRHQRGPAASRPSPVPRSSSSADQVPGPVRSRSAAVRPSRPAAPPGSGRHAAPPRASAPETSRPTPTDPAPTRKPVPRSTAPAPTTTPPTTPPTTSPTTTSPTTTPKSAPGPQTTDPRGPSCLFQPITPSPAPELPDSALLDDLAGAITLLGDCCNDH